MSIDYWRKFFRSTNTDIFKVIEKAILVASADHPDEFTNRRDHIAHTLYTCQLDRCSECLRTEHRDLLGLENENCSDRGDVKEGNALSSCDHPIAAVEPEEMKRVVSSCTYDEAEAKKVEEETKIVVEVLRIKEVLANQQDESEKVLYESLQRLQLMELYVEILMATEIGKAVNCLRRHTSKPIRHLVRTLIVGWKALVDEWMKASAVVADTPTPTDSINPSVVSEENELLFSPVDEGDLFTSHTAPTQLSKFFEGINKDRIPRKNVESEERSETKLHIENSLPVRKQDEGPTRGQEAKNRPPRPQIMLKRPLKTAGVDLKLAFEHKVDIDGDMKPHSQDLNSLPARKHDKGPKDQEAINRLPKPRITLKCPLKTAGTDLNPASELKTNIDSDTKSHSRDLAGTSKKPSTDSSVFNQLDESSVQAKLEIAKRKLHEGYQQAENAKKQRKVQVLPLDGLLKDQAQPSVKPRSLRRNLSNGWW